MTILIYKPRRKQIEFEPPAWRPNPHGKFRQLQRLAAWFLSRYGQEALQEEISFEPVELPRTNDLIQDIHVELSERIKASGLRPDQLVLIMGEKEKRELFVALEEELWRVPMRPSGTNQIFGMKIIYTSWFEGWIVLPKRDLVIETNVS